MQPMQMQAPTCYQTYNEEMAKGLAAKMFFADYIPMAGLHYVTDFGCAGGHLLEAVEPLAPRAFLQGIEPDDTLRSMAALRLPNAGFSSSVMAEVDGPSLLICSSVFHEMHSDPDYDFARWWDIMETRGYQYVAVRDFGLPGPWHRDPTPAAWLNAVRRNPSFELYVMIEDIERDYGPITVLKNFVHFLLKYPYGRDWEKELREDYLKWTPEQTAIRLTDSDVYRVTHYRTHTPSYLRRRVYEDFGFMLTVPTHVEMIFERRLG